MPGAMMLTKTDFLQYLDAPMHLWAVAHDRMEKRAPTNYELHLMEQGKAIEKLAQEFLRGFVACQGDGLELHFQKTFTDGDFYARVDAVLYDPAAGMYDIYEIKSASSVHKEHKYDVTFQALVCAANVPVSDVFIVHLNKDYVLHGELDLAQFFAITQLNEDVENLRAEVRAAREHAWRIVESAAADPTWACYKPDSCPCPVLCHPDLPAHPIYDLPRLNKGKADDLRGRGILAIEDIPPAYPLPENQKKHMDVVKAGKTYIDHAAVQTELAKLEYPLYFLDYETYNPAVPLYDDYKPYTHMVFQYSLHVFESPGSEPAHYEFLASGNGDPGVELAGHLAQCIGPAGSVVVWNKVFEAGRNKEMGTLYPQHQAFLQGINDRIYDLMEIFSKGYYVHPDFHGSASIKKVLPVLVSGVSYDGLPIPQGDEAMMAWKKILAGELSPEAIEETRQNLLCYCELDTLAMVKIWEVLKALG